MGAFQVLSWREGSKAGKGEGEREKSNERGRETSLKPAAWILLPLSVSLPTARAWAGPVSSASKMNPKASLATLWIACGPATASLHRGRRFHSGPRPLSSWQQGIRFTLVAEGPPSGHFPRRPRPARPCVSRALLPSPTLSAAPATLACLSPAQQAAFPSRTVPSAQPFRRLRSDRMRGPTRERTCMRTACERGRTRGQMQAGVSAGSESEQETERGGQSPVFPCDWNLEWEVGRGETGGRRDFKLAN